MSVTLHLGDCAEILTTLPLESVDLTVTSPPYDNLRKYKGFTFDFERIARGLWHVTKPGGVVVWIVNDATENGTETLTSLRQALYFQSLGFNVETMIYKKHSPFNFGSNNLYKQCFEYMFMFSKGKPKTINFLFDRQNPSAGRKRKQTRRGKDDFMEYDNKEVVISEYGRRENIWVYDSANGIDRDLKHPAQFPEALARDHILSWSNPGDLVLDPMMGSGTTGKMAVLNNRNFIGIEIAPDYYEIAQRRIAEAQQQMVMPL